MTTNYQRTNQNTKTNEKRKTKPAKSITISFRVKPYVLAKALTGILRFNPAFDCDALSKIGKETFNQGLNAFVSAYGIDEISTEAKYILESLSDRIKLDDNDNLLSTNRFIENKELKGPKSLTQKMKEDEVHTAISDRYRNDVSKEKNGINDLEPKNDKEKAIKETADKINKEFEEKMATRKKEQEELLEKKTQKNIEELEKKAQYLQEQQEQKIAEREENGDLKPDREDIFTPEKQEQMKKQHKIQTEKQYLNSNIAKAKSMMRDENDPEFSLLTDDKPGGTADIEDLDAGMKERAKQILMEEKENNNG